MQTVLEGEKEDDLLALSSIVALSERANHPVSKAVTVMAKGLNGKLPHTTIDNFHLVPGKFLLLHLPPLPLHLPWVCPKYPTYCQI